MKIEGIARGGEGRGGGEPTGVVDRFLGVMLVVEDVLDARTVIKCQHKCRREREQNSEERVEREETHRGKARRVLWQSRPAAQTLL